MLNSDCILASSGAERNLTVLGDYLGYLNKNF